MRPKYIVLAVLVVIFIILVIIDGRRKINEKRNLPDEPDNQDTDNKKSVSE